MEGVEDTRRKRGGISNLDHYRPICCLDPGHPVSRWGGEVCEDWVGERMGDAHQKVVRAYGMVKLLDNSGSMKLTKSKEACLQIIITQELI